MTDRRGGRSSSPYDAFNLGGHVGDDTADVAANRQRLARELGVDVADLVWMEQVHGTGSPSSPSGRPARRRRSTRW